MDWTNRVTHLPTVARALDKPSAIEHRQVLGHCLSGKGKLGRQGGRCDLAVGEDQVEDTAPRRVGDRLEEVWVSEMSSRRCLRQEAERAMAAAS